MNTVSIITILLRTVDSSSDMWMLRGYNGACYHGGSTVKTIGKVEPGAHVHITYDAGAGTISYRINDTDHGVVFRGVPSGVRPAVSFYGSGRAVRVIGSADESLTFDASAHSDSVTITEGGKNASSTSE